ncbi:MAG: hypothetical protein WAL59_06615 [Roseiarcus sp.]
MTIANNPRNYPETIRSAQRIDGLISSTNYCFAIRARTDGGTKGYVSEKTSDWACVSTFPPGAPPVASQSPTAAKAPQPAVDGHPGNELGFKGAGFTLNASASIRVADRSLRSVRRDAKANGSGDASATLNGLCQSQGWLFISATDGRAAPLSSTKRVSVEQHRQSHMHLTDAVGDLLRERWS